MKLAILLVAALSVAVPLQAATCPSVHWTKGAPFTGSGEVGSLLAVDVDQDGKVDLFSHEAVDSGPLLLRRGKGDGTFHPPATIMATEIDADMTVGDVNGDGKLDIIGSRGSGLRVMLGNGNGTFGATSYLWTGYLDPQQDMVLANFDADPALELAFTSSGSIGDFFAIFDNSDGLGNFVETRRIATGHWTTAMAAADFDGDGLTDIVVIARTPKTASVWFAKSDGTFTAPVVLATGYGPEDVAMGDVNGDGRPDIAVSHREDESVKVYRYTGTRQFTAATTYPLRQSGTIGGAGSLALRDVSGDGPLDLVVSMYQEQLVTLTGVGNGTFRSPSYSGTAEYYGKLAVADFDNDSRLDALVAREDYVVLERSCASKIVLSTPDYFVPDGDDALFDVIVAGIAPGGPFGTVTLFEGSTGHGTLTPGSNGRAQFVLTGSELPLAVEHTLIAHFSGNADLDAVTSAPVKVFMQSSTTETIVHLPDYPSKHGEPWPVEIEVKHAGSGYQQVWVTYDGKATLRYTGTYWIYPTRGTHTIHAAYSGMPYPSESPTLTFETGKADSHVSHTAGSTAIRQGTTHALDFSVSGWDAAGTLALYEGNLFLASGPIVNGTARITVPQLSRGLHAVRVVYPGDTNYHPSELPLTLEVIANAPLALEARGMANAIHIAFAAPSNANIQTLRLYRRPAGTATWQLLDSWYPGTQYDYVPQRGVVYEYRLQGTTNTGANITSNVDAALLFTDEPLTAGLLIKHAHLSELRAAVNNLRAAAGMTPFDYPSALDVVRAAHVTALRTALTQGRNALGMSTPAFVPVSAGTVITPAALQQLRELAR